MLSSLNGHVYEYIKEYAQTDESKISLPPYDVDLKKSNKFLAEESIEMIRSIRYLYGLGSEEVSKEASELIEKYSSDDNSSDPGETLMEETDLFEVGSSPGQVVQLSRAFWLRISWIMW